MLRPVYAQQITDLSLEPEKFIEITCPVSTPYDVYPRIDYGALYRVPAGTLTVISADINGVIYHDTDWQVNVRYQYVLPWTVTTREWDEEHEEWLYHEEYGQDSCYCTVRQVFVGDNQTVDSRLDLRYATNHYKDFAFKDGIYRGGLFVGNNQDSAKVSQSYLKFSLTGPLVGGEGLWDAGGLFLYMTRMTKTGSASLLVQAAQDGWAQSTLVWTNQPALIGSATTAFSVDWDSATPLSKWYRVKTLKEIQQELANDTILTLQVRAANDTSTGWPYFAKKEYTPVGGGDVRSYLLYAFGGPGIP